jgi:hypothetical protein
MSQTKVPLPSAGYLANSRWIQDNLAALACQCPDQWVAVDCGRVIAAGPDLGEVTAKSLKAGVSDDVVYEFIAGATMIF